MPPSASRHPLSLPSYSLPSYSLPLEPPAPPALLPRAPPADPVSVTHAASLSILSRRPSLSTQARQRLSPLPLPLLCLSLSPLSLSGYVRLCFSLVRSCTQPKVSLSRSFSSSLLCDRRAVAATRGEVEREVAPFAASRNLARCSFAVHREERGRQTEQRGEGRMGGRE